jgi:hypothetical protein
VSEPVDPTAGTWHDQAPAIADAARGLLRLNVSDPDAPRLPGCARAACSAIDHWTNLLPVAGRMLVTVGGEEWNTWAVDDAPAEVVTAAQQLTAELFRRKDAPFGVLNGASANSVPMYVSRDQLAGVLSLIAPYREGWGFA